MKARPSTRFAWGVALPPPRRPDRAADALASAGRKLRTLEHQLSVANGRIAALELDQAQFAAAFIDLVNTPGERQAALIAEIANRLDVELPP